MTLPIYGYVNQIQLMNKDLLFWRLKKYLLAGLHVKVSVKVHEGGILVERIGSIALRFFLPPM